MRWIKDGVWPWVKKYWKWVLFPVGILTAILAASAAAAGARDFPPPDDLDKKTQDHLKKLRSADEKRNAALVMLENKKHEKLNELSKNQMKELKQLRSASTEEVVSWFDRL